MNLQQAIILLPNIHEIDMPLLTSGQSLTIVVIHPCYGLSLAIYRPTISFLKDGVARFHDATLRLEIYKNSIHIA